MPVEKTTPTELYHAGETYVVCPTAVMSAICAAGKGAAEALAIWVYLQSKPAGWQVRHADIERSLSLSRRAYTPAMRLLRQVGLIQVKEIRGQGGRLSGRQLVVNNSPKLPPVCTSVGENVDNLDYSVDKSENSVDKSVNNSPKLPLYRSSVDTEVRCSAPPSNNIGIEGSNNINNARAREGGRPASHREYAGLAPDVPAQAGDWAEELLRTRMDAIATDTSTEGAD